MNEENERAEEEEENESFDFVEFKGWLTSFIVNDKKGELPDHKDWVLIKQMMDRVTMFDKRDVLVLKPNDNATDPGPLWRQPTNNDFWKTCWDERPSNAFLTPSQIKKLRNELWSDSERKQFELELEDVKEYKIKVLKSRFSPEEYCKEYECNWDLSALKIKDDKE